MGALRLTARPAAATGQRADRRQRLASCLVLTCYLLAAFALTWRLWAAPALRLPSPSGTVHTDVQLSTWFMRYAATAVSRGHLPALVTTQLNWPEGVSMMWNTSLLLPGVVLAPITLLWGPVVSLNVLLTLGFAGSAASLFWVLRRWGASLAAAAVGGTLYGFSPAMRMAAIDHYHIQFAVLPPLIIDAVARLVAGRTATSGRHGWLRIAGTGIWLGVLVAAQLFIAEEVLVDTALAGLVMVVVLLVSRPSAVLRLRMLGVAAAGLVIALAVALVLAGHAVRSQFSGPLAEKGTPWRLGEFGNQPAVFVRAPTGMVLHGAGMWTYLARTHQLPPDTLAYLGWPLLVLLIVLTVWCWRDLRARVAAVCWVVLDVLSVGGHRVRLGPWRISAVVLPWHWLERLPLLGQVVPNRLSVGADGAAAALLAFAIDKAWRAAAATRRVQGAPDAPRTARVAPSWLRHRLPARSGWLRLACLAVLAVALVPLVPLSVGAATITPPPAGWSVALTSLRLPAGARVLMLPVDSPQLMQWQAVSGEPYSIVPGYCIVRGRGGHAATCGSVLTSTRNQETTIFLLRRLASGQPTRGPDRATFLSALLSWRPAAVLTPDATNARLRRYLVGFLGPPTVATGAVLGWRLNASWYGQVLRSGAYKPT